MELRFHPAALAELRKSADFYTARSPEAAQRFAAAVDDAINSILANPQRYSRVGPNERGCSVVKFPFQIIYRTPGDILYVVAVAHAKRRPGYWKRRK